MSETYNANSLAGVQNILAGICADVEKKFNQADFTPQMQSFLDTLEIVHGEHFASSSSPSGEKWPPLAKRTVEKKGHATILVDTGKMKASVVGETGDSIRSATHRGLVFGTEDEKAIFHQTGTKRMPKREFIGMDETLLDQFCEKIADAAVKAIGGSGGATGVGVPGGSGGGAPALGAVAGV